MPHFNHWTKNALSRLTYYLPKRIFYRNQMVFKEGEFCEYVFVVLEGEFEITKRVKQDVEKQERLNFYIGPIKEKA
jgi:CRP-like cAMP-binding protein